MDINVVKHDWMDLVYPEEKKTFDNVYGKKSVFPMHNAVILKQRSRDVKRQLWKHCAGLYDM